MKDIKKIIITNDATIKKALSIISAGATQIAIVVDKKGKLLGTLTDGDIRRGYLRGMDINSPINSIINKKPFSAKENDTKEKILKIALKKKIYQIPVIDKNRKVIGLHVLDELIKPKDKSNLVVIMAGGKGMRLRPLTKDIPKPMLKIKNKPILQTIIEKFIKSGYYNFAICVNYKSKVIIDYFGNGKKFGAQIKYVREKIRMGTAGALSLLKKEIREPFFVMNGDILINLDFDKLLKFHEENNSEATMCIKEYNVVLPYGEVRVKKKNIISIEEKPKHKFFVNAGIYILDPKCINLIPRRFYNMTSLFRKMINKKDKIELFPLGENWLDIGRIDDYGHAILKYNSIIDN